MTAPPLPFLYQTRTILQCRRLPRCLGSRLLHQTTPTRARGDNDIPFARDLPGEDIPIEDEEPAPRGTITANERQTFERIFADIAARGLQPNAQRDPPAPAPSARRTTNLILERAAQDAGQQRPGAVISPALYIDAAKDKNKALLRFPPSLRAAASRAFELLHPDHPTVRSPPLGPDRARANTTDEDEGWGSPTNSFQRMVEIDAKRHPEQKRVEALMSAARTDFDLWDVMEKEVFTYPEKLGLGSVDASPKPSGRKAGSKASEKAAEPPVEPPAESASGPPTEKLDLYLYGPLYPSFLLFGLRRLDTAFTKPSPLTLSVLPRIKDLGLESFVLGVSTPFYNELLSIYYRRYGNLSKMMELLEEMRHSGLYFDENTAAVLNKTYSAVNAMGHGKRGTFAQAVMSMPDYERSLRERLRQWHRTVDISIAQRDVDIDYQQLART
ncbi:uncharacterized protein JN550_008761 [Neoarthrinium moseri]|uniref:uncharacterized protein n=1 Tax=Neoarthrinium moseri TaxID=1658444 RepID=UPI001FDE892A|nr:uncharacterized protein JN550_008761 [Neoarthrinium moseri]KAI1864474.1 hypothetical protein JN550_008761 [Neoarthrinium moseri]